MDAEQPGLPFGDDPIVDAQHDLLGRAPLAAALADQLGFLDAGRGAVAAIVGPWGSGKTSLLNLTAADLRGQPGVLAVVDFNPRLFSGTPEVTGAFLAELATALRPLEPTRNRWRSRGVTVTDRLSAYSTALELLRVVPGVATVKAAADDTVRGAHALLAGDRSLQGQRQAAVEALRGLDGRVVVLIDDIDRLTRFEIRDLFRMIRLTASFPNVVYLLCLDRSVVEAALADTGIPGRDYLSKILTVTCDVPAPAEHLYERAFSHALDGVINANPHGPFDEAAWTEAYNGVIQPLLRTMRDAKRLLASLPLTLRLVGDELRVSDVVALEALRTLAPQLHDLIGPCAEGLTTPLPAGSIGPEPPRLAAQVQRFVAADPDGGGYARDVLEALFPAALRHTGGNAWAPGSQATWRHQRRVAHLTGLRFYLSHHLPTGTARAAQVQAVVDAFGDLDGARAALAATPDDVLLDVLRGLQPHADNLEAQQAGYAVEALLELVGRLPPAVGPFAVPPSSVVGPPVLRFLRGIPGDDVHELCLRLVPATPDVSAAVALMTLVGHRQGGHQLVDPRQAQELEHRLRQRLQRADAAELIDQPRVLRLLYQGLLVSDDAAPVELPALADVRLAAAVLSDAVTTVLITRPAEAGGEDEHQLAWDVLARLFGSQDAVYAARDEVAAAITEGHVAGDNQLRRALALVDRYRTGWRPPGEVEEPRESPRPTP